MASTQNHFIQTLSSDNPSVSSFIEEYRKDKFGHETSKQNKKMAEYANKHRLLTSSLWTTRSGYRQKSIPRRRLWIPKTSPEILWTFRYQEKINDVSFSARNFLKPMKVRGIHDIFHVTLLKTYTADLFCREPQPEPAVLFRRWS